MSAFIFLCIVVLVNVVNWALFVAYDVKVWLDESPETETASTVIRRWMKAGPFHFAAVTSAILLVGVLAEMLVAYLLGHFPLGWW